MDCVTNFQEGDRQGKFTGSFFKILGTGKPPKQNLFFQLVGSLLNAHTRSSWKIVFPKVRPGPALGSVIGTVSSRVIMWVILSLQKGLRRLVPFYFAVTSGTAALWSELQEGRCFSGLRIIVGLVTTCFLSLETHQTGVSWRCTSEQNLIQLIIPMSHSPCTSQCSWHRRSYVLSVSRACYSGVVELWWFSP